MSTPTFKTWCAGCFTIFILKKSHAVRLKDATGQRSLILTQAVVITSVKPTCLTVQLITIVWSRYFVVLRLALEKQNGSSDAADDALTHW